MLLAATSVFGQSAAAKRAAQIAGKPAPLPNQAAIMAAASTNFEARCAVDYRWRDATNKLAKAKLVAATASESERAAARKFHLTQQSGQSTTTAEAEYKSAIATAKAAQKNQAACELQKIRAEEAVRSVILKR